MILLVYNVRYGNCVLYSCVNIDYCLQVLNELIAASDNDVCIMTAAMLEKAHILYKTDSSDNNPQ